MSVVLVTGVSGEVGSSLVHQLSADRSVTVVGFDKRAPSEIVGKACSEVVLGDISDTASIRALGERYAFNTIYHLAGVLSSGGEKNPTLAHSVNVTGTLNLLELAREQSERRNESVKFIFTSTIAVYGMPGKKMKSEAGAVTETEYLHPITMYGANKLYCEALGAYYADHFGMLDGSVRRSRVDFRCVRFPGILNAHTLPTGGTSDYAPEMVHAAAQGKPYTCFVREDSKIPFLMMPDAVRALTELAAAPSGDLSRRVYSVAGFSPSASEIADQVAYHFPDSDVTFVPHETRQKIVDSWPEAVNDSPARRDWGWQAQYSFESGFAEYLVPEVNRMYNRSGETYERTGSSSVHTGVRGNP